MPNLLGSVNRNRGNGRIYMQFAWLILMQRLMVFKITKLRKERTMDTGNVVNSFYSTPKLKCV